MLFYFFPPLNIGFGEDGGEGNEQGCFIPVTYLMRYLLHFSFFPLLLFLYFTLKPQATFFPSCKLFLLPAPYLQAVRLRSPNLLSQYWITCSGRLVWDGWSTYCPPLPALHLHYRLSFPQQGSFTAPALQPCTTWHARAKWNQHSSTLVPRAVVHCCLGIGVSCLLISVAGVPVFRKGSKAISCSSVCESHLCYCDREVTLLKPVGVIFY